MEQQHLDLDQKLRDMMIALYSANSQQLNPVDILPHIQYLLSNKEFMDYTLEYIPKNTEFHEVHREIFVKGRVYFTKIENRYKQFALAWLYTLFH